VEQDQEQAIFWFARAARQDVVEAQEMMCTAYALGRGVKVDVVKAYAWCEVAAANASKDAKEVRANLLPSMNREQVQQAEEVARILRKDHIKKPAS
jgi:TPR repeat protein